MEDERPKKRAEEKEQKMEKRRILILCLIMILLSSLTYSQTSIIDYDYIYENLSKIVPVYKYNLIEVEPKWNDTTLSFNAPYNYTNIFLIGYETEYYNGRRIGISIDDKEIIGYVNVQDNILSQWSIPIGGRNFKEYGKCRIYETEKGVCFETKI